MANIIYSKSSGANNAAIGKLETPIKVIIEHESDAQTQKGGIRDWLFNVVKTNNFIDYIRFVKQFDITAEMMEDANYAVDAEIKRRAEAFVRAYYRTQHQICQASLANATSASTIFEGATIDLTTDDKLPLFSIAHKYGTEGDTQSNLIATTDMFASASAFEEKLNELANLIRNMKDENGNPLGYTADTIILPGNRPAAEMIVKKAYGFEGAFCNDIKLQCGNWNIIVMPDWQTEKDAVMVMSSEANKKLGGNMFFNCVPLTIKNWEDKPTSNYCWVGRCRFGVGFGTYKHILLAKES